jgi:hypothetical protein
MAGSDTTTEQAVEQLWDEFSAGDTVVHPRYGLGRVKDTPRRWRQWGRVRVAFPAVRGHQAVSVATLTPRE